MSHQGKAKWILLGAGALALAVALPLLMGKREPSDEKGAQSSSARGDKASGSRSGSGKRVAKGGKARSVAGSSATSQLNSAVQVIRSRKSNRIESFSDLLRREQDRARYSEMKEAFSTQPAGESLAKALTLYPISGAPQSPAHRAFFTEMEFLQSNPLEALEEARQGSRKLPGFMSEERRILAYIVSGLKAPEEDRLEYLKGQLDFCASEITCQEEILNFASHVSKDPQILEPLYRSAISSQTDHSSRAHLDLLFNILRI